MDDQQRAAIERACERLVVRYSHLIDHGAAAEVVDLFTDDGVFQGPHTRLVGRNEILAGMGVRQAQPGLRSRHVCTNFICDVIDEDHASGVVYLTLYRRDGVASDAGPAGVRGPTVVGEYRDAFARTPDGWRIASRECVVSFVAEEM